MLQGALLGLVHVLQHRSGGDDSGAVILQPQPGQGSHPEMLPQHLVAGLLAEKVAVQSGDRHVVAVLQLLDVHPGHIEGVVANDFRGRKLIDLVEQLPVRGHLGHQEIPGADVGRGHTVAAVRAHDAHQVVVLGLIQSLGAGDGTRRHHPDDLPLHQALGLLGVLHLLGDGHLVALLHQAV